jgi:hypothetical protein
VTKMEVFNQLTPVLLHCHHRFCKMRLRWCFSNETRKASRLFIDEILELILKTTWAIHRKADWLRFYNIIRHKIIHIQLGMLRKGFLWHPPPNTSRLRNPA